MRQLSVLVVVLSLLTQGVWATTAESCPKVFLMGWTDIPPAFYGNELRQPVGVDVDILDAVFERLGCQYIPRHMPFKRYITSTKFGAIDLVMSASKNAERETYGFFSVPYRRERFMVFTTPENQDRHQFGSFEQVANSDVRIAAGIGMWVGQAFHTRYTNDPVFRDRVLLIEGYSTMLRALVAKRIEVVVGDEIGLHYLIDQLGLQKKVIALPIAVNDNNVHFMFSKKTVPEAFVRHFDQALEGFLGSPEHLAILAKHPVGNPQNLLPVPVAEQR